MSETKLIPAFKSDEEEVEFRDCVDTAEIFEKSRIGYAESKKLSEVLVGLLSARSEGVLERRIMGANMPFFYPMHVMPPYKNKEEFPVAEDLPRKGINLPSGVGLKEVDIERIVSIVNPKFARYQIGGVKCDH
ncbi:hypothetical protein C5S32_07595 [ANME-1 cluster archaeon GoMg1]|nr:hypothetical protein [ANME-1 cluster archaeon GoMg1]